MRALAGRVVALPEYAEHVLQAGALGYKQDQVVVKQVGGLVEEKVGVVVFGLDDQFHGFLAYFLGHFVDSPLDEAGRVGFFGGIVLPFPQVILEVE